MVCCHGVCRIAERLVSSYGSEGLHGLTVGQWVREAGVGFPNACRTATVFEFGRRFFAPPPEEPRVGSPAEAYALVRDLAKVKKEHLVALYLDAQNRLDVALNPTFGLLTRPGPSRILPRPFAFHRREMHGVCRR